MCAIIIRAGQCDVYGSTPLLSYSTQWNLSVKDLRIKVASLIRIMPVGPATSYTIEKCTKQPLKYLNRDTSCGPDCVHSNREIPLYSEIYSHLGVGHTRCMHALVRE